MLPRRRYERVLDQLEPLLARAFTRAVRQITSRARFELLVRAIASRQFDDAIRLAGIRGAGWSALTESIREGFVTAGNLAADAAPASLGFAFDVNHARAQRWLMDASLDLARQLDDEVRLVVRFALTEGLERNLNPRATARMLIGRFNRGAQARQGGLIQLTKKQARWVLNARDELASGNKGAMARYLRREARDRRFDGIVERAIREGRPVGAGDINRMTRRYSEGLLKMRGEAIARTETLQAVNRASYEAVRQAGEQGLLRDENVARVWRTSSDGRVRDIHRSMNGQRRLAGDPFVSGNNRELLYPGDTSRGAGPANVINCRCYVEYDVDWLAEGEVTAA